MFGWRSDLRLLQLERYGDLSLYLSRAFAPLPYHELCVQNILCSRVLWTKGRARRGRDESDHIGYEAVREPAIRTIHFRVGNDTCNLDDAF